MPKCEVSLVVYAYQIIVDADDVIDAKVEAFNDMMFNHMYDMHDDHVYDVVVRELEDSEIEAEEAKCV